MVSSKVYVPSGRSTLNCSDAVSQVTLFLSPETVTLDPPVFVSLLKSMFESVVLSFIVAPVSSPEPVPVISFLLKVTVVGVVALSSITTVSEPVTLP